MNKKRAYLYDSKSYHPGNLEEIYDLAILGAGVVGASIALEMQSAGMRCAIIEKDIDVSTGASKANSGIIHGGYTAKHGTLKGQLSYAGNKLYPLLSKKLEVPFKQIGAYVLAFDQDEICTLESLIENGKKNGVQSLEILNKPRVLEKSPHLNPQIKAALHAPEVGIVSPYELCIALIEATMELGSDLFLNAKVSGIESIRRQNSHGHWECEINNKYRIQSKLIINAAGLGSQEISSLIGDNCFNILARKGQYLLLRRDTKKNNPNRVKEVIFQTPTAQGKGILVTPTTWGNIMIGPDAQQIEQYDRSTDPQTLDYIIDMAQKSVPSIPFDQSIRSFAGIRASSQTKDFIIGPSEMNQALIHAAGIDSPGLTASPAIAVHMNKIFRDLGFLPQKAKGFFSDLENTKLARKAIVMPHSLDTMGSIIKDIDRKKGDPNRIVCRCEQVREKTIVEAMNRTIPLIDSDSIKRRTRAGMGPCQGQFCRSRVQEYLEKNGPERPGKGALEDEISENTRSLAQTLTKRNIKANHLKST